MQERDATRLFINSCFQRTSILKAMLHDLEQTGDDQKSRGEDLDHSHYPSDLGKTGMWRACGRKGPGKNAVSLRDEIGTQHH